MESEYFIFDGIKSSDMGLYNVRVEQSGFIETPYWGEANIEEEYHKGKTTPYFYGIKREPIEFTVQFALADKYMQSEEWTPQKRNKIAKWLLHDTYKPFQTCDDLGKIYYVICISEGNLNLINTKGYVELTFRCNSPYAWTPVYLDSFDLSDNLQTIYVGKNNIIKRISANGKEKWSFEWEHRIYGLVSDNEGYMYVFNTSGEIAKISPVGNKIWSLNIRKYFNQYIRDIAVDSNNYIYFLMVFDEETSGSEIVKINPAGNEIFSLIFENDIRLLVLDNNSYIYIKIGENTIKKISPNGDVMWSYDKHTSVIKSMAIDNNNNIYSGYVDGMIKKISPNGDVMWSYAGENPITALTIDNNGYVYSGGENTIKKISPSGEVIWSYLDENTRVIYNIIIDNNGYVYYSGSQRVLHKLSPEGNKVREILGDYGFSDLALGSNTEIIKLENKSNVLKYYKPKIEIELVNDNTDVSLKNLSNNGEIFSFTGLKPNEIISIDNENEFIKSNNQLSNPFSKFNRKWLKLVYGVNQIEVKGQCKLWIKSCFPIAQ